MFRDRLAEEFALRKQTNSRYSLRAFAAFLGADHSTVSKVMQGSRRATVIQLRAWAKRLGIAPEEIAVLLAAEQAPGEETLRRQSMMRHWTAEADAVIRDGVHLQILQLCRAPEFRADCRWIAWEAGVSVDAVNLALQRLLRLGLIELRGSGCWKDCTGLARLTPGEFRRVALARVRQKAAEDQVKFGKETIKRG